ncbi:YIP1 family protein [Deinococcus sp. QL22]|uniref:YIP1 family protein n=1 Tax=Deinococcus sp. QL22 TaxID=2939437 RepID=UPI0020177E9A|nr:YIP1 family protein [Deinococcus sp. QL22]UQN10723.1 YIP1 family protein [Deinococcus sp. QL22]
MLNRPRQAFSTVLDQPRFNTHVGYVLAVFILATSVTLVLTAPRPLSLVTYIFLSWISLVLMFYVMNLLCLLTARALGGGAGWKRQQLALVWGLYPMILVPFIGGLLLFGVSQATGEPISELILWLSGGIGGLWSVGLTALNLATVHGLSVQQGWISAWPVLLYLIGGLLAG